MVLWITTRLIFLRQYTKSLHTRNQEIGELGMPTGSMDTRWDSAMHYFRGQDVYISTTASERIVDTLEFFAHNYQCHSYSLPTD
jgi:hypothetical protein